jgi:hypothetical protein
MKVHMITMAALAAASLSAQGVAQQGEQSLERALADLNTGLTAPAGSSSVDIGGDARIRNLWTSGASGKNIDARARLYFNFNVNENAGAVISVIGYENWGTQGADQILGNFSSLDTRIDQAYYWGHDLFGDGGTFTIGRKYFTLGSGRILGSDDWDQAPSLQTGVWYDNEAGGANLQVFFLNSQNDDRGAAALGVPASAMPDYMGLTFDWTFEMESESVGDIHISPYILSPRSNGLTLDDGWYLGSEFDGSFSGFGWDAEWVTMDEGGSAFAASTTIALDALESMPGVNDGSLRIELTSADKDFAPLDPIRHAVVGIRDSLGGGTWTTDTDTISAHLGFAPGENWNGKVSYYDVSTGAIDQTEWDLQVGTTLVDAIDMWFGYAHTSSDDAGGVDDDIIWTTLGIAF